LYVLPDGRALRQPKDDQALDAYRRAVTCFKEAAKVAALPAIEPVEIPYEGGKSLPAYFVKASVDQKGPLPTVIFFDGLDVTKEYC